MGIFNNQNQNSSAKMRFFGALMIAAFAFIMYMNNTQINPVTGVKQHVALTPNEEIRLGLESAPQMASEMGGELPANDPRLLEVQRMGNEIVSKSDAHKGPWKFKFHVVADPKTVNAFALPGGQVFITAGLLNQLQTEAQLAGVLSHEMGHVIQRHAAQQMAKGQLGQMLIVAASQVGSDQGSSSAAIIASVVNQMLQLRYSRNDELEADQWGLKLMSQAGYDPLAMLEVMEILKKSSGGGRGPDMFQTHPHPEARMEQIKEYLKQNPPAPNLSEGKNLKPLLNEY